MSRQLHNNARVGENEFSLNSICAVSLLLSFPLVCFVLRVTLLHVLTVIATSFVTQ